MAGTYKINGREYEWADISMVVGGVEVVGFREIKYKREIEKEALYAKGRKAISIQAGNEKVSGSVKFTQSQLEALELAAGGNILTAKVDIIVSYGAELSAMGIVSAITTTDVIIGAEFTEYEKGMAQGDKFMEISLPFIALDIKNK